MQLISNGYDDTVFEWIPYNQFNQIKKIGKDDFTTVYSAVWKDGPLESSYKKYRIYSNKEIVLKCLHNSQNSIEFVMTKVNIN